MFNPIPKPRKTTLPSHRARRRDGVSHVPLIRTFW